MSQFFVKPGQLFEIFQTHDLRFPFPDDWNELVFEIYECMCYEYRFHILAPRFGISLLRVDDLSILQEPTFQLFPDQRT